MPFPVFGGDVHKQQISPPPLDANGTPRRSALKSSRCSPEQDEEQGMSSFDTPSRPLRKKNASFSAQLEEVHPIFELAHRSSGSPWCALYTNNAFTATWMFVSSGFALITLVLLVSDYLSR